MKTLGLKAAAVGATLSVAAAAVVLSQPHAPTDVGFKATSPAQPLPSVSASNPEALARMPRTHPSRASGPVLPHPVHGAGAIRTLGDNLGKVAAVNGRSPSNLRRLLATDSTMWLTRSGRLFVRDNWTLKPEAAAGTIAAPATTTAQATAATNVFALHSRPGAQRIIYLDFVGANLGKDIWTDPAQQNTPVAQGNYAPWHLPAGDPNASTNATSWTPTEQQDIQEVWARVAEHYAPFDVDVTTDPASAALLARTSTADQTYGIRVLFSGGAFADSVPYESGSAAWKAVCPPASPTDAQGACGGIASLGTLAEPITSGAPAEYYGPAWIFTDALGNNFPKYMADAAAHEAGHSFDLTHQGTTNDPNCTGQPVGCSYYGGNSLWGPLMGDPYNSAVTQWAKGEYANANNQQDEIAAIEQQAPALLPSAGTSLQGAVALAGNQGGFITGANDHEFYSLGSCSGTVTVTGTPASLGPDLDINLTLLDSSGNVVTSNDAADVATGASPPSATGMDASLSLNPASPTTYYLEVSGGGSGAKGANDPVNGFSNYASAGAYTVSVTGCAPPATPPSQPTELQLNPTNSSAGCAGQVLSWQPPTATGNDPITSYEVAVDNSSVWTSVGTSTSATFPGINSGHTYRVRAMNAIGASPTSSLSTPSAVTGLTVAFDHTDTTQTPNIDWYNVSWSGPTSLGGAVISGYRVTGSGVWNGTVYDTGLGLGVSAGAHPTFAITAFNAAGDSASVTSTLANGAAGNAGGTPPPSTYAGTPVPTCSASTATSSPTPTPTPTPTPSPVASPTPTPTPTPSPSSAPSPTPSHQIGNTPSAVRSVKLARGAPGGPLTCLASWLRPSTVGPGPISYQVRIVTRNAHHKVVSTRIVTTSRAPSQFKGKRGDTYRVQVRAHNRLGWGRWSPWSAWTAPR